MNKYDRYIFILNLLRARKNMNAQTLAEECKVTERTIYRDIISLSEMNVPIYFDNGYKLASDFFLPPIKFSMDEYALLTLAIEASPFKGESKYKDVYSSLKIKLEACLSNQLKEEKKLKPLTSSMDIHKTSSEIPDQYYTDLEKAIYEYKKVEINYISLTSGETRRKVDPYFIIFRNHAFYFVGYCNLRKEFRTFRLDRIKSIEITEDIFNKDSSVTPQTYFEDSWSIYVGEKTEVCIIFSADIAPILTSSKHHENEKIEILKDGSIEYTVKTRGIDEIKRWILTFGENARVIAPTELRDELKQISSKLNRIYNN